MTERKAVKLNEENEPDLILLDIMMPKLDGYAACRKIREKYGHSNNNAYGKGRGG